jgi:Glyoxalase-like domain
VTPSTREVSSPPGSPDDHRARQQLRPGKLSAVHRSRLTAALVDVPPEHYRPVVDFWSGALGIAAETDDDDPEYASLGEPIPGLSVMVQEVDAPARLHLDIETDDVEAEVERLVALGAERVEKIETWWVMRDPAGLLFCVVRVQNPDAFEREARSWSAP